MTPDRDHLLQRFAQVHGATLGEGAFGPGPAVWVGQREVAHFDSDGALDIRLTKAEIRARRVELRSDGRIGLRGTSSDWLEVQVVSNDDAELAVALVSTAVAANLADAPPGSPPTGADLARRRRFH